MGSSWPGWWHLSLPLPAPGARGGALVLLLLLLPMAFTRKVHTLYWNSTNPVFHSASPLLVNMEGHQFSFDQVAATTVLLSLLS